MHSSEQGSALTGANTDARGTRLKFESRSRFAIGGRENRFLGGCLEPESVIFFVRADPEPCDHIPLPHTDRAIVITNTDHTDSVPAFFKLKGGMIRVAFPERILLAGEFLHRWWKRVEGFPKPAMRSADHGRS